MSIQIESNPADPIFCLYHNDPDGQCAAAIVRRRFGKDVILHPIDYGLEIPWKQMEAARTVIIVDFSMPLADMLRVQDHAQLIWIDHHKTALEDLASLIAAGLRALDRAGCVLTWQTFFPQSPLPRAVRFIGERDIWAFEHNDTKPFCEGLYQMNGHPSNDKLWDVLLDDGDELVARIVEEGILLLQARMLAIRRQVRGYGYAVEFEGHKTLAINVRGSGELGEHIRSLGYDVGYTYYQVQYDGVLTTHVTLYSGQVDVSEIARRFGGGGHPGASGFTFPSTDSPFPPAAKVVIVGKHGEGKV